MMTAKIRVHAKMIQILNERIAALRQDIQALVESRNTATKSSAGDKHETARAMLQNELDTKESQLQKTVKQGYNLQQLDPRALKSKIEPGSLIYTSTGIYYISIGLGKVTIDTETIYAVSPASPIGKALINSNESRDIHVNNREIKINSSV